jgi:choline kinase
MSAFRVCLPTAGIGSRLGERTRYLNKSLVGVANRPILSHLIEMFPDDTRFVIALGHKGDLVRDFLALAYPDRTFDFAEVDPFIGPGSGLGLSLLRCAPYLHEPFIFLSCDTLVRGVIPPPTHSWMGVAERDDLAPYRTLRVEDGQVRAIAEKGEGKIPTHKPYIGLAGIADPTSFWRAMEQGGDAAVQQGEAFGLRALLPQGIEARTFDWMDTGNVAGLDAARAALAEPDAPVILDKPNEAIWFVKDRVVKFSDDAAFIANRVKRFVDLEGFVPAFLGARPKMYAYRKAPGRVLSDVETLPLFARFLDQCEALWRKADLDAREATAFREACRVFYHDKTLQRVQQYYRTFGRADTDVPINGQPMPTLAALFERVDWDALADGLPARFHGDLHFENVLWDDASQRFTYLDWRQDFGGSLTVGDVYYDLAKIMHGLIVCHPLIAQNLFSVASTDREIRFDFHRRYRLVVAERAFEGWMQAHGYDVRKTRILTALIYLNIAALHHDPYCHLLYALGKSMLAETLKG